MKPLIGLLLCFLAAGCEQIVDDPSWPDYEEKGILHAEMVFEGDSLSVLCNLGRTVPLNQQVDFLSTRINHARIEFGRGSERYTIPAIEGDPNPFGVFSNYRRTFHNTGANDYSISAEWDGLQLDGRLTIPDGFTTEADSIFIAKDPRTSDRYIVTLRLFMIPDLRYTMWWYNNGYGSSNVFWDRDLPKEGRLVDIVLYMMQGRANYSITAVSEKYRNWWSSGGSDDPFEPTRLNPKHNITGDGIGFFTFQIIGERHWFDVK